MNKFILATDSCCDIFKSELAQKEIYCRALSCIINGEARKDIFDSDKEFIVVVEDGKPEWRA